MHDSNLPEWSMAALPWREEKVTKRIYVDRHHNYKPIGKEDGVILVNWVFGVFFVDRTMLMSKTIISQPTKNLIPG